MCSCKIKLEGQDSVDVLQEDAATQDVQDNSDAVKNHDSPEEDKRIRTEMKKDMPLCVPLPTEVRSPEQAFPFLNTMLADMGIVESAVKECVVWVDNKRTRVRIRSGKVKEKEVSVLEIRVKAQLPGQTKCQEVLYSTASHTDRLYFHSGITFLPWTCTQPEDDEMVEMTLAQSSTTKDISSEDKTAVE